MYSDLNDSNAHHLICSNVSLFHINSFQYNLYKLSCIAQVNYATLSKEDFPRDFISTHVLTNICGVHFMHTMSMSLLVG